MKPVVVKGCETFKQNVLDAIQRLSKTEGYEEHFLRVVRTIKEASRSQFAATMGLSPWRGTISIRLGCNYSGATLICLLAHEAYHNVIFHEYLRRYWFAASFRYRRDLAAIERRCVARELQVADELDINTKSIEERRILKGLLPHQCILSEQYEYVHRLRRSMPLVS